MKATHIWLSLYLSFVDLDSWVVLYHPLSLPGLCTLGSAGVLFSRFLKLLLISVWSYICCLGRFLLILFQIWCWYKDGWVVLFVYFSNSQTFHSVPAWMWLQKALMMKMMTKDWDEEGNADLQRLKGKMMLKCFRIAMTEDGFQLIETLNATWYCRLGFWSIDDDDHDQCWSWWPSIEVSVDKYCQLSFCSLL